MHSELISRPCARQILKWLALSGAPRRTGTAAEGREGVGLGQQRRFRNRGIEYVSKPGMRWMRGRTERQRDRACIDLGPQRRCALVPEAVHLKQAAPDSYWAGGGLGAAPKHHMAHNKVNGYMLPLCACRVAALPSVGTAKAQVARGGWGDVEEGGWKRGGGDSQSRWSRSNWPPGWRAAGRRCRRRGSGPPTPPSRWWRPGMITQ